MQDILIILGCIVAGMAAGRAGRRHSPFLRAADVCSMFAVYVLLFILGAGIGADPVLIAALPALGVKAITISLCCTAGSVLCVYPLAKHFPGRSAAAAEDGKKTSSPLLGSLKILCAFVCGILFALAGLLPLWLTNSAHAAYVLFFLVFTVGVGLGANLNAFRIPRALHGKVLSVPLLIIAGSALGALVAFGLLPDFSVKDSLCVGMGLGYYSLASILIENAGNSAVASVALLSNITREIITILGTPLLVRFFGGPACVAAGGATTMDSTLPVIARFAGERVAVVAVFSGMTLTLLVPFLVTAALGL